MKSTTINNPVAHQTTRTHRSIWSTGLRAGLVAVAATELFATIARVGGVPMRAGGICRRDGTVVAARVGRGCDRILHAGRPRSGCGT